MIKLFSFSEFVSNYDYTSEYIPEQIIILV